MEITHQWAALELRAGPSPTPHLKPQGVEEAWPARAVGIDVGDCKRAREESGTDSGSDHHPGDDRQDAPRHLIEFGVAQFAVSQFEGGRHSTISFDRPGATTASRSVDLRSMALLLGPRCSLGNLRPSAAWCPKWDSDGAIGCAGCGRRRRAGATWQSRNRHLIRSHHARSPSRRDRNRASDAPRLAMDAGDGVKGRNQGAPTELRPSHSAGAPSPGGRLKPQAMADPVYDRIDLVTLTLAVVLAAGIVFLLAEFVPELIDLMMMPPPLSGAH